MFIRFCLFDILFSEIQKIRAQGKWRLARHMLAVFYLDIRVPVRDSRRTRLFRGTNPRTLIYGNKLHYFLSKNLDKLFSSSSLFPSAFISANKLPVFCFLVHSAFNNFKSLLIREMHPASSKFRTILVEFEFKFDVIRLCSKNRWPITAKFWKSYPSKVSS